MKIVHWNILDGGEDRWPLCADWLTRIKPDVLALCECNGWGESTAQERLGSLGLPHVFYGTTQYGYDLCWASREPCERVGLPTEGFWHGALRIRHPAFEAIHTHLAPGNQAERVAVRKHEADVLVRHLASVTGPLLLTGDLNSYSPGDADILSDFTDTSDLDSTAVGRLLNAGLVDLGAGVEPRWSLPTALSDYETRIRLDYMLASPALAAKCGPALIHQEAPLPRASDHFPVVMEMERK
jgi:exonuclease III